jgi:hypothetical protein
VWPETQEIQHAIANDREPNRRPRPLANKIGENLIPRHCLKPQFIPAIAFSWLCAPFSLILAPNLRKNDEKVQNLVKNAAKYASKITLSAAEWASRSRVSPIFSGIRLNKPGSCRIIDS